MKKILKAVFVIIGTLIGAGFASGQEIILFFQRFGWIGFLGLLFSNFNGQFTNTSLPIDVIFSGKLTVCNDEQI